MVHHYVHCDSTLKRSHDSKNDFEVFLTPPIQNVKKVALTRLSVANTFYNITDKNKTFHWFEIKTQNANQVLNTENKFLSAEIPVGFYSASQLAGLIQTAMNATQNRLFAGESVNMSYFISVSPLATNFKTSIYGSHTSNYNKEWALSAEAGGDYKNSIWDLLGFNQEQCVEGIVYVRPLHQNKTYMGNTNVSQADRTLTSTRPARETYPFIQLHSNTLASNSRELTQDNNVHTRPSKRLGIVPVNVNRYSWINWEVSNNYEWHDLTGTISKFDLKFCNDKGEIFDDSNFGEYQCTLLFETEDVSDRNYEREALAKLGYIKAHCR